MTDKEFEAYNIALDAGKKMEYKCICTNDIQPYVKDTFLRRVQYFLETIECNQLASYFDMILEPDYDE